MTVIDKISSLYMNMINIEKIEETKRYYFDFD